MPAIEVGRVCVKVAGRESGKKCVIVDVMDKSFVVVTGPKKVTGVKRRRVNINHVAPTEDAVQIKRGASDEEVTQVLEADGKLADMAAIVKRMLTLKLRFNVFTTGFIMKQKKKKSRKIKTLLIFKLLRRRMSL
jgi:large subunit ribosomal protein L14e